jgi:hypothetical protein
VTQKRKAYNNTKARLGIVLKEILGKQNNAWPVYEKYR